MPQLGWRTQHYTQAAGRGGKEEGLRLLQSVRVPAEGPRLRLHFVAGEYTRTVEFVKVVVLHVAGLATEPPAPWHTKEDQAHFAKR